MVLWILWLLSFHGWKFQKIIADGGYIVLESWHDIVLVLVEIVLIILIFDVDGRERYTTKIYAVDFDTPLDYPRIRTRP